jgi:PhnB protein
MEQQLPKGLVPHLVVKGGAAAIDFYKKAWGAEEILRMPAEDGKRLMHAQMKLDGSTFFLADDFPEYHAGKSHTPAALGGTPVVLHRYVPDVDAAFKRATDAGGKAKMPPTDMFWGDRYGQVEDPFGHVWSLATPLKK